ncbi:MAG: RNA methyltransferase [Alistipes sp.]|nr:RNA methyltransferase [Alistipes sp.]
MIPNTEDNNALKRQIAYLEGFMLPERAETLRRVLWERTRYLTVCMENTFHPQNASALMRSCEAFGLQELHTVETLCTFSPNVHIVRGTDKWIDRYRYATTSELIASLRARGYRIVATSPHTNDCTPECFDITQAPTALFFGTEHAGLSSEVMESADAFIRIPMCGFVESLNVSASAAILLYQLSTRLRQQLPRSVWQLPTADADAILLRWMKTTVKDADRIMERGGF